MTQTVLAVDLGGTKILVGEVTPAGEILKSEKYPSTVVDQRSATEKIKTAIRNYLQQHTIQGELIGIGVCVVGRVDTEQGRWMEIHPGLSDPIFLADELTQAFQLPCWITNDVSGAALAESILGVGQETGNFVYINIGTGIAARVVADNHLIKGGNHNAGEVGHMVVDMMSEDICTCGRAGCAELYASGLGMHNQVLKFAPEYPDSIITIEGEKRVTFQELIAAYEANDGLAKKVLDQALHAAAALTMNLIRVSDPEAVVFGGGVMNDGWFLNHLVTFLNAKTVRFVTKGFRVTTLDPNEVALKGAATLAFIMEKGVKTYA
ncbi:MULTISPECIES: ROK family protein [Enterococcus]|uniref:ROK family protein n=1 Tax=Candidatus Enterococcus murrayae TaxID=2815321 RepID=A0ABS3HMV4_9ENTE|nr:ROK family protein [Enterococcus sp. MJM16]MBO0454259.1 ROK family protein [Enterococcus sp. MJM16]